MFKKIDHVEIITNDLERAADFYINVLGFRPKLTQRIERSALGVPLEVRYLTLGDTSVELLSYEGATADPIPSREHEGYRMIALEVEDMEEALHYLKSKGVEAHMPPRLSEKEGYKYLRAEITDPNGFRIELRQWLETPATG